MASRFKGTCIGGVADGHWIERDDPNIRIQQKKKTPKDDLVDATAYAFGAVPTAAKEVGHTDYKFVLLLGTSNAEIGVWAPQDVTLEQVVERLVKFYNPRTGMIGEPKPNNIPVRAS